MLNLLKDMLHFRHKSLHQMLELLKEIVLRLTDSQAGLLVLVPFGFFFLCH